MNDLKVGMYIRDSKGLMYQLKEEILMSNPKLFKTDSNTYIDGTYDLKVSSNIIDLIEAGDYVNGYPVLEKVWLETGNKNKWGLRLSKQQGESHLINYEIISEDKIKSIVTHEQFNSLEYKVVD